jgi:hypothetical protein
VQPLSLSDQIAQLISSFSRTYIIPYLPVLIIALLVVWVAFDLTGRRRKNLVRAALRAEIRTNIAVTKAITAYADKQLSGQTSISPMPRYHMRAFLEYKRLGMMEKVPPKIAEELENLYLNMESVNKAGKRQEDLAFGPASAYPNAHNLRIENLTFARDTVHNIIAPYEDRLSVSPK